MNPLHSSAILALAVALTPLAVNAEVGPRVRPAAKTAPRAKTTTTKARAPKARATKNRARAKARAVPRAKARAAAVRPVSSPEGSAAMAALLRQFVDGKTGAFDGRLAGKLSKHGLSKADASKLLANVDGASTNARKRAFGNASVKSAPTKAELTTLVTAAGVHDSVVTLMNAITLPPHNIPSPSSFELRQAGLVTLGTEDGDASDELTMLAIVATPSGDDYTIKTVDLATGLAATPGAQAKPKSIFVSDGGEAMLVTALIEDDGGNAAAARTEIETLVGLAASVAATMPGTDRIHVLQTMVDYTIGLDAVGADPGRAARSVATTAFGTSAWFGMWSADAEDNSGIGYKLAIPHAMGSGNYELLLDVPGDAPDTPMVRVQVKSAAFEAFGSSSYHLKSAILKVGIGDQSHTFSLGAWSAGSQQVVQRRVLDGKVNVWMSAKAKIKKTVPQSILDYCANAETYSQKIKCNKKKKKYKKTIEKDIDLAPGSSKKFSADYNTKIDGFVKATNPKKPGPGPSATAQPTSPPLSTKTAKGTDSPIGTVKIKGSNTSG